MKKGILKNYVTSSVKKVILKNYVTNSVKKINNIHSNSYTDGTINLNLCGAKKLFQYIMFCNRSFLYFLKLSVKQLVVMNIINFFDAVSDIIFQYSFFHAVSDIILILYNVISPYFNVFGYNSTSIVMFVCFYCYISLAVIFFSFIFLLLQRQH